MLKDDDFKLLRGFADEQMNRQTDICDCRVAFATENGHKLGLKLHIQIWFSTLYYHDSQRKKMEHELGD